MTGEEAKQKILHDFPEAKVEIKDEKAPLTRDFRVDRVRIAVDKDGKVTRAPATG